MPSPDQLTEVSNNTVWHLKESESTLERDRLLESDRLAQQKPVFANEESTWMLAHTIVNLNTATMQPPAVFTSDQLGSGTVILSFSAMKSTSSQSSSISPDFQDLLAWRSTRPRTRVYQSRFSTGFPCRIAHHHGARMLNAYRYPFPIGAK